MYITIDISRKFSELPFTPLVEILCGRVDREQPANVLLHREREVYGLVEHQSRNLVVVGLGPIQDSSVFPFT